MPCHFKKTEPPSRALRRICCGHIGMALEWMRKPHRSVAIHNMRKEIKKARAVLRLMRGEIGRGAYRQMAKSLRKAANHLAPPRDARVMLQAFCGLTQADGSRFPETHKALRQQNQRETRRFRKTDALVVAGRLLRKTKLRIGRLKIKTNGWAALEPNLHRSYGFGRDKFGLVRETPSAENFHAWRKHVKNFWHHLWLLCPDWPSETARQMATLEMLGERLGDEHDLALLQQFLMNQGAGQNKEVNQLNRLMAARQKQLRDSALQLGSQLYAETPSAICRRLENEWKHWRGEE